MLTALLSAFKEVFHFLGVTIIAFFITLDIKYSIKKSEENFQKNFFLFDIKNKNMTNGFKYSFKYLNY